MSLSKWLSQKPSKFLEDLDLFFPSVLQGRNGLSISSDDKNVYIEAQVPGLTSKDVEVSIDNDNTLWIKGTKEEKEEDKKRKYYRRYQSSFSYAVPLGDEIDLSVEPKANCKDGVMKITLARQREEQKEARKIRVE